MRQADKCSSVILGTTIVFSWFYSIYNFCQAASAKDSEISASANKKPIVTNAPKKTEWWATCEHTAKLINVITTTEREKTYASLLTRAKQESPNSLELGILLSRYGLALYSNKKYELAVTNLAEAVRVLRALPDTERKQRVLAQTLGNEGAALGHLKKFNEAEICLRQAIAYAIAFPNIRHKLDLKKCYVVLRLALENQNKQDEVNKITGLMTEL